MFFSAKSRRTSPRRISLLAGAACALLAATGAARADQSVYTDSLQNGWTNWSWAGVNFSAAGTVHSGADAISAQAGPYQALYLHHAAQSAARLTALRFWIHGGVSGGQKLQVQATLGGAAQPAYALSPLRANAWTLVTIPLAALGVTTQTDFDGFWVQDSSGQAGAGTFFVDDAALLTAPAGTTITIDAAAGRRAISPLIYGVAYADAQSLALLNAPLNRQGGNNTTRYNWLLNADSKGADYFFESLGDPSATPGERGDTFIAASKAGGAQPMLTVPMIGWTAKLGPSRGKLSSFSVAKYGPQKAADVQWMPDAGSGVRPDGTLITGNDPSDASAPATPDFQAGWVSHLVGKWGQAAKGGLRYYLLDNEPSLWHQTHRDVHPQPATLDEIKADVLAYSAKIKSADPSAVVVGPEEWGWPGFLYSGADQQYRSTHGYAAAPDKNAHGGLDALPWLLDQVRKNDAATGHRSLDVLSVHFYPQGGEFSAAADTATTLLRNRSTRQLWDPNYVSESWIGDKVMLIPRLQAWSAAYYPGTGTAITEYNWGSENSMSGATAQADVLGIFGREGLSLAARWTTPDPSTPTFKAMQMFRNYDGKKSGFGETSVADAAPDPDTLSSFAALRRLDGALTVMVINKSPFAASAAGVSLLHFAPGPAAQVWQLTSANAVTRLPDAPVSGSTLALTVPAQSITLLVIPRAK